MLRTAEFVSPNHPDKMCDRISDAILDECLKQDPMSRVAIETMGGHGIITITGELTTKAFVCIPCIVKKIIGKNIGIQINIIGQSREISRGVDDGGAGDQGIAVGYACRDNEQFIPQEHYLAKELCKFIYNKYPEDGKTQITWDDETDKITKVVASFNKVSKEQLREITTEWIEKSNFRDKFASEVVMFFNPAGDWETGSFDADTGLTGRKIVVDNYGPRVPVGGGCFSGKDATKVDRTGAYMARRLALTLLKADLDNKIYSVLINLAFAIGVDTPIMLTADARNKKGESIGSVLVRTDELKVSSMIEKLELRNPIFEETAKWGPFGNGFIWDK